MCVRSAVSARNGEVMHGVVRANRQHPDETETANPCLGRGIA